MRKKPRKLSLVRFNYKDLEPEYHRKYPFTESKTYIYFGEIANMLGHCVVMDHITGQFYSGYHTENFIELSDDET